MEQENLVPLKMPNDEDFLSNEAVMYICGACGKDVELYTRESLVRCRDCGYRILYKKRTKAVMQYEAR